MLGYTEYCDNNGVSPASECKFDKVGNAYEIEIKDFSSCGISSAYNAVEDYVSMNLVQRFNVIAASSTIFFRFYYLVGFKL